MGQLITFIIGSAVLLLIAWVIFRVIVRKAYREKGRLTAMDTFLEVLIFFLHGMLSYSFTPPGTPPPPHRILVTAGWAIFILGIALTLVAIGGLGWRRSLGQKVSHLKQEGLYRYTRNPQILFYSLVVAGYALIQVSWYGLAWVALYAIIAQMMVATEEEHLLQVYGDEYRQYCHAVPRYIGFRRP